MGLCVISVYIVLTCNSKIKDEGHILESRKLEPMRKSPWFQESTFGTRVYACNSSTQ